MAEQTEEKEKEDFVHPDGGYGWVIVVAIILINSTLLTLVQCFGIIFKDEFKNLENETFKASFLLHLQSSLYCVVGFFSSPFLKIYDFRRVAIIGAILMCLGVFLTSFASSYSALIFTVSVLTGVGQGILMPATYLATYTYFKKRLTVAISLSTTGASLSSIFMPKICDILLKSVGRRNTILTLSATSLVALASCFLLKPLNVVNKKANPETLIKMEESANKTNKEDKDESADQLLQSNTVYNDTTVAVKPKEGIISKTLKLFDLKLFKEVPFVFAVVGLGFSFAAELNTVLLLQFILPDFKLTQTDVANVTSIQFALDLIGRLAVPLLAHWFSAPSKVMYSSALVIATVARTVLSVHFESHLLVFVCCALIGLAKGIRAVFQSVIIPKLVALDKIPAANGINFLFNGAVSIIIGSVIGVVRDKTNSAIPALHTASTISMLCILLWMLQWICLKEKHSEKT